MSNFSDQIQEIKTSISSGTNKSLAYSTLLYLQEQSTNSSASIQTLAETTPSLIPLVLSDVHDQDEEIAGQALKCLGFMMYHPSLSTMISVEEVDLVLQSLTKLITTTKMKSVCNLGVWCISIQQFSELVLVPHFDSLLQAVVHGLENPMGSLSTTFEAIQAVMRLAVQLAEKMRGFSHVWAPSIYRRLLSPDKRERDMSERCLLKIRSQILPPSLNLSKVLVKDMKQTLLARMKDFLSHGSKVQTIKAWGWFIRLLGPYALKNRNLINDMLKIPEHTFSDHDPQLQIASQVAWEGLIDALIQPALLSYMRNDAKEDKCLQQTGTFKMENNDIQANGFSKSLKLIMTPLLGIMSSKCDASVYTSCFNTWCYLLHKLGSFVNSSSVKKLVLQPVYEAIFQTGPDCKSLWVWNLCIDLLDDLILAKCRQVDNESFDMENHRLSASTSIPGPLSGKFPWKQHPIKWLPWELSQLDFHIEIIYSLIKQASKITLPQEKRALACDASLRLFRSVLKGVQMDLRKASTTYDDILLCLNTILRFIKYLCEENSEGSDRNDLHDISLQLIEVVTEEIEPAMLASPLYKVALDLKHIESQSIVDETRQAEVSGMCYINYMDMVSPVVYLTVLYYCVMAQSNLNTSSADFVLQAMRKYFKIMLSSYEPEEVFVVTVGLLYKNRDPSCLRMWTAIAENLKAYIHDMKSISLLKLEYNNAYFATCALLSFPFIICYCHRKDFMSAKISSSLEESHVSLHGELELDQVTEVWMSLYGSLCTSQLKSFIANDFPEDLCNTLDGWLDKYTNMFQSTNKLESSHLDLDQISFFGGVVTCILEKFRSSEISADGNHGCSRDHKKSSAINRCLTMAIRFMRFLQTEIREAPPTILDMASRLYSALAHFISCLHLKQDILSFVEIISSPLLQWLARIEMQDESTNNKFQLIWSESLNCLRRSQPPLIFDSTFLKLQSPLLEKTLDHPSPSISVPTISFWNLTYGNQIKLDYPENLLHVLDKLSRNRRINLHKKSPPFLERCDSRFRDIAPEKYKVNATNNRYSKRIGPLKGNLDHTNKKKEMQCLNLKRKRLELTEHQKEVRRAQQGRERDSGGHGLGGIRTYTNLDFSQGNEDSQESQEIWNLESILDMSKKA